MPTPAELQQDIYLAEAAKNAPAVAAYLTKYPERAVGETITDSTYGFDWKIELVSAQKGFVFVYARYVDAVEGETEYIKTLSNIMLQQALYTFAGLFLITEAEGVPVTTYTLADAIGGEMMQVTIEGVAALNPATDYTWDSETGELEILVAVMTDQQIDYLYKKNPYS